MKDSERETARDLARSANERGDPTGWFEELYQREERGLGVVPWADRRPNRHLTCWAEERGIRGGGRRALVVGCGYGDDAEWLASRGFDVLAFDIAPTAISVARRRFANSPVEYVVADVLDLPHEWNGAFDFVFEAYTLQVLQGKIRRAAVGAIASTVKDSLLVIARGRDDTDDPGRMPWPLTRGDLGDVLLTRRDLKLVSFEDYLDDESPPVRRFRVEFGRVSGPASSPTAVRGRRWRP